MSPAAFFLRKIHISWGAELSFLHMRGFAKKLQLCATYPHHLICAELLLYDCYSHFADMKEWFLIR